MEISVGYRKCESKLNAGFAIVFPDTKTCYLRNFGKFEKFMLEHDPIHFLSHISQFLAHEFLHLWLNENISQEACSKLNNVDGFFGFLVERTKICAACQKPIRQTIYIMHGWLYWHKKCIEKHHDEKCVICNNPTSFFG